MVEYDGNYASRVCPPRLWWWIAMAVLWAVLVSVCIHEATMDYASSIDINGEYVSPTQGEMDRAMDDYGYAAGEYK